MKTSLTQRKNSALGRASRSAARSNYMAWSGGIAALLDEARRQSARAINAILTATYWEIGRRIVAFAQQGEMRAEYGEEVLVNLSRDLTEKFGRGFSVDNLQFMRAFHVAYPPAVIYETLSRKSLDRQIFQTVSGILSPSKKSRIVPRKSSASPKPRPSIYETLSRISSVDLALYLEALAHVFPLSWSQYVRLLSVEKPEARQFYETEAVRGGWSVRQLDRQISTLFYERTALSKNKARLLTAGAKPRPEDLTGDLKLGRFTPADAGQMNMYVNYAAEHLTLPEENPPIGLILCSEHDEAVAHYSMGNQNNQILARQFSLGLPDPRVLEKEIEKTRRLLESPARRANGKR